MKAGCISYAQPADGSYEISVELSGGTGRAGVRSPAYLQVENGQAEAVIEWTSPNYDYMIVDGEKLLPVENWEKRIGEGSVFRIPVETLDQELSVIADTVAMGNPHEIEYQLYFSSDSVKRISEVKTPMPVLFCILGLMGILSAAAIFRLFRKKQKKSGHKKGVHGNGALFSLFFLLCFLSGCGKTEKIETAAQLAETRREISPELHFLGAMELVAAGQFAVNYYNDGYAQIVISDGSRFLLVPEGKTVPEQLDGDVVVLEQPVDRIYLVATAAMDMFRSLDALDRLRFSGTAASGWQIEEAREAMEAGELLYAGKYNAPDYERILSENCSLAVENTMIFHSPEVRESLEKLGIPVLVDYSSYEPDPLGRMEWIKLYGLLTEKEKEAEAVFLTQKAALEAAGRGEKTGKTAAFFYLTANGAVNVRKGTDYIGKLIEQAGGTYLFSELGDAKSRTSTETMQMEQFFDVARDADVLIYNSTVDGPVETLSQLVAKNPVLADFKAVKEGTVWCTSENLYQESMGLGTLAADFRAVFTAPEEEHLTYLFRLH
ncbi:MAG: ABC transporter substrate-binding protein [Otoolea sp.]